MLTGTWLLKSTVRCSGDGMVDEFPTIILSLQQLLRPVLNDCNLINVINNI